METTPTNMVNYSKKVVEATVTTFNMETIEAAIVAITIVATIRKADTVNRAIIAEVMVDVEVITIEINREETAVVVDITLRITGEINLVQIVLVVVVGEEDIMHQVIGVAMIDPMEEIRQIIGEIYRVEIVVVVLGVVGVTVIAVVVEEVDIGNNLLANVPETFFKF